MANGACLRQCPQKGLQFHLFCRHCSICSPGVPVVQRLVVVYVPPFVHQHLDVFSVHVLFLASEPPRLRPLLKKKKKRNIKNSSDESKPIIQTVSKNSIQTMIQTITYSSTIVNNFDLVEINVLRVTPQHGQHKVVD